MYLLLSVLSFVIIAVLVIIAVKFAIKLLKWIIKFILKIEKWLLPVSVVTIVAFSGANAGIIALSLIFSVIWYAVLIYRIKNR